MAKICDTSRIFVYYKEMKVNSVKEAWNLASRLFPTDYKMDDHKSKAAGYKIYFSTAEETNAWISDLGNRLELNYPNGSTENIWIEEETGGMTVESILRIMNDSFVCIHMNIMGAGFTSEHSKDYFLELEDKTLLQKEVKTMYASENKIHLVIK